jgi:hypothetical protein
MSLLYVYKSRQEGVLDQKSQKHNLILNFIAGNHLPKKINFLSKERLQKLIFS